MLSELRGGDIDALVLDRNFIDNTAATDCDFVAVGTPFSLADVGYGLALNMQEPLERDLNRVIRDLIQSGVTEKLRNTLILRAADTTKCRQVQVQLNNQVKLDQVAGLWVMLAIALMFALLALGIFWLRRRRAVQWLVLNGLPSGAQLVSSKVFGGSRERLASLRSAASAGGVKGGRGERELSERRKDRSGGDAFD
ncbi:hypothetical protein MNEG_4730 [Monoraphidium neglectum]|uniref:Solute-binding protein family 3/N-terminal domain-containing protein n=1 Tax=Monoraphidium neglectum TaxID=145388 RepID=A0A0D2JX94_9CHLO|nr:hypothetical protein MNEG_4730 [Monoraphidium neglectum]KIZ03233.1 hypothetical protein MNEG_4730 [Monoraphidium neglectum]|eukprot:XP_013902252.1 hypothetical protein MNEG_4730 [Monoraphidium neglectum]